MDSKTLLYYKTLAETLHFHRASTVCHVSPSTLSRSLKLLEEQLGSTLVIRDNRSVTLTAEGIEFYHYAKNTLMQWDAIKTQFLAKQDRLVGELSIYCSVTASYSFLHKILNQFRLMHPRIDIKLHTGDPAEAINRVRSSIEHIAIGAKPENLSKDVAFQPIASSPLVFIAANEQPELINRLSGTAGFNAWLETPMILSESGLARNRVDMWMKKMGIKPRIYAQVAGNEAIVSMVSLGFGVGVVPDIVLENSPLKSLVSILPVEPALKPFEVGIFVLEKSLRHPLIHAFWDQCQQSQQASNC